MSVRSVEKLYIYETSNTSETGYSGQKIQFQGSSTFHNFEYNFEYVLNTVTSKNDSVFMSTLLASYSKYVTKLFYFKS